MDILPNEKILIVDTQSLESLPEGKIGEIWIQSPSLGEGYWEKPAETIETFQAFTKTDRSIPSNGRSWILRWRSVVVAGRVKDLIIVRGVNRYPQDIEQTIEECHESIPSSAAAAFADTSGTARK